MDFVRINGIAIHYRFLPCTPLGDGGQTFLFINSLGTDFRIWDEVVDLLKDYSNVLLFDKRGHGLSDVATDTNSLNDFADDVEALISYLNVDKIIVVGLSVGGMIAQIVADRIPHKIHKLILCCTSYKIGDEQTWNARIEQAKEHGLEEISSDVMQRWFSEKFRNEEAIKVSGYKNMLERTPVLGYIQTCEAIRGADLTTTAKQINIQTLCIAGSEDKSTTPAEVKKLADLIEGSEYSVIENSGHIPCIDNASALSKMIIDFVK